ncbi:trans-aconitate 2-methyltransferase [Synechococcus sp. PCC 6312]|uniref:class I SAM-dependent methyltransferase n=1 Tax=Synechococcus sp. (strain ATCC 27167 / PCC 6312) TaxID=195253 RepID=UPI00029F4DDD|nr:class I SAM-dependent methyltransferase [Synechococcus sp. PCC 6312]AFY62674.1 methylase involved in ubiquinone/menaquinone biosynthesis [Synechococcus sp. PCC 6312]
MTEWHADDYHRQSGLQQVMAEEQLGRLVLEGDERILDIGCGDGKITAEIAMRLPRGWVLGIDPSREMVAFASSRFGRPVLENLHFEVADARQLPYQNEFDLVVSFNALHWVVEQDLALCSIRAVLKPGGRALLRLVPSGQRKCLEDIIEEVCHRERWINNFTGFCQPYVHFTPEEYRVLAEKAGFRVVKLNVEDKAWDFKTRKTFFAFAWATFVEWTQHLPESEWESFITDVLDSYQLVAADNPEEVNTFKFYQMEVEITPVP